MEHDNDMADVRDGLNNVERTILTVLHRAQQELAGRALPTAMLYGRVLEHIDISEAEMVACLQRMGAGRHSRQGVPRSSLA